jgi:sigma-B regulation protein RsbU (phosphoserine phosphatase)
MAEQAKKAGDGQGREARIPMRKLPGYWNRDWKRAYSILTTEGAGEAPPRGWWARLRALYRGVKVKLTPARRALFVLCLILALLGANKEQDGPWHLVAFVGIVFLLLVELADRTRTRDEMEVARQLQRDLLPKEAPELPGYEFAFSYRAANTIGGDYYHFVPLPDGRIALLIGDASGHGMAAGLLMAIADTTIHIGLESDPSPLAVTELLNAALIRTGGTRAFMTLFVGLLDPGSGVLTYLSAGHPFPLLRRADGAVLRLGEGSFPLGIRETLDLASDTVEIAPGDLLMLYTDGIPEAVDADGESFGYERLQQQVEAGGSAEEVHDRVLAELSRFEGLEAPMDDRSLVVVQRVST